VLVVDDGTDRAFVRAALGQAADAVRFYELNKSGTTGTQNLFHDLLRAAA
jgi:hypothetical protein